MELKKFVGLKLNLYPYSLLEKLLSIREVGTKGVALHKVISILGIRIKLKIRRK